MMPIWNRFLTSLSWQFTAFFTVAIILDVGIILRWHLSDIPNILGLAAIEFAVITLYLDFRLHRKAEQIALSSTTRYLSQWPRNLADLTNLISGAHRSDEIAILVDFFGYAHFSNPEAYKDYLEECKAAIKRGVTFQILLCGEKQARKCHETQLENEEFPSYLQNAKVTKWLKEYENSLQGYQPENQEAFIDTLMYLSDTFCLQLLALLKDPTVKGGVTIRTMSAREEEIQHLWMRHAVYCWILRHREQMIFCFPRFYGPKSGDCFQTHDSRLIASYLDQFDKKWKDNVANEIRTHVYDSERFRKAAAKIDSVHTAGASQ